MKARNILKVDSKIKFLRYTYAVESISAALKTRNANSRVYEARCTDAQKAPFKKFLLLRTLNLWLDKTELSKKEMLDEITALKHECEEQFASVLNDGKFRIGVSQKLICLYAKFLWVSGQLTTPPPLIPYDGVVKSLLNNQTLDDWTVLDDMKKYEQVIEAINIISEQNPSIWELSEWNKLILPKN